MTIGAVALLKIPYAKLCEANDIEPAASADEAWAQMSTLVPIGADACACVLDMPLSTEPAELADAIAGLVGGELDLHDDDRGVLVVPENALKDARPSSYEAAIGHFGEAGQWVPKLKPTAPDLQAMMGGDLMGTLSQLQGQLQADPRMLQSLGGAAGGGDLFQVAQQMLSQMSPGQQAQLEQMAKAMFGNMDPSMLAGMRPPGMSPGGAPPKKAAPADDPEFGGDDDDDEFGSGDAPAPAKKSK